MSDELKESDKFAKHLTNYILSHISPIGVSGALLSNLIRSGMAEYKALKETENANSL